MGVFGSIGDMMSNPDYKRFVQFGRAWQAGWRPQNYSMSDGVSDWKQQLLNWYNSYGSTYDVNEAINYWNNLREKEYDSNFLDGLEINLPVMAGSKGFGVGDAVAVGNLGLSALNYYQQAQLQKAQLAQMQANNALSYQMFVEGNRYNSAEAQAAFDRSFNASKYSTQAGLMRNAGLNPAMMFGEGNTISPPSSQSASSLSAPALHGAVGINAPQIDILGFANAVKALADAKKSGIESKFLSDTLEYRIRNEAANSLRAEVLADIDRRYADEKAQKELKVISKTIDKLSEDIDVMVAQEGLINEQTLTQMYDTFKNKIDFLEKEKLYNAKDALGDFWEKFVISTLQKLQNEGRLAGVQADWLPRQVKAQETNARANMVTATSNAEDLRKTRAARINSMNADAREKNSLAAINEYELDTRPSKIVASYHNFVDMVTSTVSATTSVNYLRKELDLIGEQIEAAKKHNDWFLAMQLMDNAKDIAIAIGSIAIAKKNFGSTGNARPVGFSNYK